MKTHPLFILAVFGVILYPLTASTTIDWIGSYSSDSTPWKVTINEDKPSQFRYNPKNALGTIVSPSAWHPHKGWFVFIENDSRLWAFDGNGKMLLFANNRKGQVLYEFNSEKGYNSLPTLPPDELLEKLPQQYREKIHEKFK